MDEMTNHLGIYLFLLIFHLHSDWFSLGLPIQMEQNIGSEFHFHCTTSDVYALLKYLIYCELYFANEVCIDLRSVFKVLLVCPIVLSYPTFLLS